MRHPITTISIRPRDSDELVKAGELIDISGAAQLTLHDRRVYNILLQHAHGPELGKPGAKFEIDLAVLRDSHGGNDRVIQSVENLMRTLVRIKGDPSEWDDYDDDNFGSTQLLGPTDFFSPKRERGRMRYQFPDKMSRLLQNSSVYARLQTEVMLAFKSKYSLVLYELISKRRYRHKTHEEYDLVEFRDLMGVPQGKLEDWSNLRKFCIKVALDEVNHIAPFWCLISPLKEGRQTVGVRFVWGEKDETALVEAQRELDRHSAGRRARREGRVEHPTD